MFVRIITPLYSFCGDLAEINNKLLPNYFLHIPNINCFFIMIYIKKNLIKVVCNNIN